MKKIISLLLLSFGLFLFSCSNDDDPSSDAPTSTIDKIIPKEIRVQLEKHITFYTGENPPFIEGEYKIDKCSAVFCSDNNFEPGEEVSAMMIKFFNQNLTTNKLDYASKSAGSYQTAGIGGYISGGGNNFTALMVVKGTSHDVPTKEGIVISGTLTDEGIKNIRYAFVMIEKGKDPYHQVMEAGVFRVFEDKDGMAVCTYKPKK